MPLDEQLFPRCIKAIREGTLRGTRLSDADAALLGERLALPPDHWLLALMREAPVIGQMFELPHPDADAGGSELDDELGPLQLRIVWPDADMSLQDMTELYPGKMARGLDYVVIGTDLSGSGDPLFVRVGDRNERRVVQILHAACGKTRINPKGILPVLDDVDQLFEYVWNRPGSTDRAGG